MIVDLPDTTAREVNRTLVRIREEGGAIALGRVLTLVIDADGGDPEEAIKAANDASREHPCRVIVLVPNTRRRTSRLDAEIRVGGDAGASEVVVLRPSGQLAHHGDTLVTPLLLSDAPIVTWWPYEVPKDPAHDCIGAMSARRITDTTHCAHPDAALPVARPAGRRAGSAAVRTGERGRGGRREDASVAQPAGRVAGARTESAGARGPGARGRGNHRSAAGTRVRARRAEQARWQEGDARSAGTTVAEVRDAPSIAPRVLERGAAPPRRRRSLRRSPHQGPRPDRPGLTTCVASSSTRMRGCWPRPSP